MQRMHTLQILQIYHNSLGAMEEATKSLCKILLQEEPLWMAKRVGFAKHLELLMMEALRKGMSQHFAGITPCVANDLAKILTLTQSALGKCIEFEF